MDRLLFLDSVPAPGAENMALDEMLLERAGRPGGECVLRLYSFEPPAITIGHGQDPEAILDFNALRADGLDCVRRITGGRALLHDGELTYCVAAPARHARFGAGLAERYLTISRTLAAAIRSLGVEAEVSRGRETVGSSLAAPPCLASVTRYELTVRGRKIAGSAQRTTAAAFLQHGSILVRPGSARIVRYLRGGHAPLETRITSIEEEVGTAVDDGAVRAAVERAFSDLFGTRVEPLLLSRGDAGEIASRAAEKRREMSTFLGEEVCAP